MKKFGILLVLLFAAVTAQAHALWIETAQQGALNKKQEVKVFYGEYGHGLHEKVGGDTYNKVKGFTLWAIAPDGKKTELTVKPEANYYLAWFTPAQNGTYTIALDNNEIEVIDFTKYNFGIFKTHYHALTKVNVGTKNAETAAINPDGITITDVSTAAAKLNGDVTLKVLYKGQPTKDIEVDVEIGKKFGQKIKTDDKGEITFSVPFNATYMAEATKKEEVPGNYKGKDYQFVWHCATYTLPVSK